ncbi:hypothetical protein SAMN06265348_101439 [Pedobacter westerhofensis]|uniref:Uncharacterized protein n=1 Tax=Pedobacter westerhofensis TaxID=425512 RepID=A0A521AUG8_9SPHI|nr:hypothetical protein SAMN06265348_101439 [Pedobacter westerhofensis]
MVGIAAYKVTDLISHQQIVFRLGFDYPTYFNNTFRKKTFEIPKSVSATAV